MDRVFLQPSRRLDLFWQCRRFGRRGLLRAAFFDQAKRLARPLLRMRPLKDLADRVMKRCLNIAQGDAILRASRTGERWLNLGEIEFERVRVDLFGALASAEEALRFRRFRCV